MRFVRYERQQASAQIRRSLQAWRQRESGAAVDADGAAKHPEPLPRVHAKLAAGAKIFRAADDKKKRSDHAEQRKAEGRRTGPAFNDAQTARQADVYIQPDGRFVVRGPRGREHIFEPDGEHVTTIDRSNAAHQQKVAKGERQHVTDEQFAKFERLFK